MTVVGLAPHSRSPACRAGSESVGNVLRSDHAADVSQAGDNRVGLDLNVVKSGQRVPSRSSCAAWTAVASPSHPCEVASRTSWNASPSTAPACDAASILDRATDSLEL